MKAGIFILWVYMESVMGLIILSGKYTGFYLNSPLLDYNNNSEYNYILPLYEYTDESKETAKCNECAWLSIITDSPMQRHPPSHADDAFPNPLVRINCFNRNRPPGSHDSYLFSKYLNKKSVNVEVSLDDYIILSKAIQDARINDKKLYVYVNSDDVNYWTSMFDKATSILPFSIIYGFLSFLYWTYSMCTFFAHIKSSAFRKSFAIEVIVSEILFEPFRMVHFLLDPFFTRNILKAELINFMNELPFSFTFLFSVFVALNWSYVLKIKKPLANNIWKLKLSFTISAVLVVILKITSSILKVRKPPLAYVYTIEKFVYIGLILFTTTFYLVQGMELLEKVQKIYKCSKSEKTKNQLYTTKLLMCSSIGQIIILFCLIASLLTSSNPSPWSQWMMNSFVNAGSLLTTGLIIMSINPARSKSLSAIQLQTVQVANS